MQKKASDSLGARVERRSKPSCVTRCLSSFASPLTSVDIKLTAFRSAFFHRNSFEGYNELYIGQAVSFIVEKRPKGAAATKVKEEGGGLAIEEEGERETGKVKVCLTVTQPVLGCLAQLSAHAVLRNFWLTTSCDIAVER